MVAVFSLILVSLNITNFQLHAHIIYYTIIRPAKYPASAMPHRQQSVRHSPPAQPRDNVAGPWLSNFIDIMIQFLYFHISYTSLPHAYLCVQISRQKKIQVKPHQTPQARQTHHLMSLYPFIWSYPQSRSRLSQRKLQRAIMCLFWEERSSTNLRLSRCC